MNHNHSSHQKTLIVVESATKCKTILNYINNKNTTVLASYGHIRSLPTQNGSVLPQQDFKMIWQNNPRSDKYVKQIVDAAKKLTDNGLVLLATDPDREGAGIAQHIYNLLKENNINCTIKRIIFNEITNKAVNHAINNPTDIDHNQVDAYLGRLALDYLMGFSLSQLLYKKVKGCRSAGRVQSATLRSIVEREMEIVSFKTQEYWTIKADFILTSHQYDAELLKWQNRNIEKFMWNEASVNEACELLKSDNYIIDKIENKNTAQSPNAPFTTSTLQQEASTKLGWAPKKTAQIAQMLYEGVIVNSKTIGLITYIRTDSVRFSDQALTECADFIKKSFGEKYHCKRIFANKSKVAQDAHEAIRPTDFNLHPDSLTLDPDNHKLYKLIWTRAVASQMSEANFKLINIFIKGAHGLWKIHDRVQTFDGFMKLNEQQKNCDATDALFQYADTTPVTCKDVTNNKNQTEPRPRFTEAGIIKHMDEVGVGRPSTYALTIQILKDRNYVTIENKKIVPLPSAFLVIGFLNEFCNEYIQDKFTANIENELDMIAQGNMQWKEFLKNFWVKFDELIKNISTIEANKIKHIIELEYGNYFFQNNRTCPLCETGQKIVCNTNSNIFIGCSNHPQCNYRSHVTSDAQIIEKIIGHDPNSGEKILLKDGQYGEYLHWEEAKKNISIPVSIKHRMTFEIAMLLKNLPLTLGTHPYTKKLIQYGIGKYGPYILYDHIYVSCKIAIDEITIEKAVKILGASNKILKANKEAQPA